MVTLEPFLTAYDPSDLPGTSVDPLGFDRGYTLLADKVLPGLTNVANRPRYFSTLTAAIAIADSRSAPSHDETPRARTERRREAVLRAERFWALACVLASDEDETLDRQGIRGIRYVHQEIERLRASGGRNTAADFRLLSRQHTYGMLGLFGTVADQIGLLDRSMMSLGPDLGRRLAEAYLEETQMPDVLRRAIASGGTVALTKLTEWGHRAHVNGTPREQERRVLREAVEADDTRRRMTTLLQAHPGGDGESEQHRFRRILEHLAARDDDADIREALRAIRAYEHCFRLTTLAFVRLLWRCEKEEHVTRNEASSDAVIKAVYQEFPAAVAQLEDAISQAVTPEFQHHLDRLADVSAALRQLSASKGPKDFVERVLSRHRDVQRGKVDKGRPKSPWLEMRDARVVPTLTSALYVGREPESIEAVAAHPYRSFAADQFFRGCEA